MPRIDIPDRGFGEHIDWMLLRPEMAVGVGAFSEAVYGHTTLPPREREAARWTIALINHCAVCQNTRSKDAADQHIDEGFYAEVAGWHSSTVLSDRERMAAEFAQRFANDHLLMDDELWSRARALFSDEELADLTICCALWLGTGRAMAVMGVEAPAEQIIV
jgi:alkylhydroperoxidase family enzyme